MCFLWLTNGPVYSQAQDDFTADGRAFIELLVNKKFATAVEQFDSTMKTALPEPKLAETWTSVLAQVGPFKQAGAARVETRGAFTVVIVTCDFQKAAVDVSVVFDQEKRVAGLFFASAKKVFNYAPPAYVKPDAFREKETNVGTGEWTLPATLTIPVGAGPFPAVVLVHGSGPNDRDETIGANKPFKDLALGLAAKGIAVLRFDKRTKVHGAKLDLQSFGLDDESVDDAVAAVELLASDPSIDAAHVFVLGHSLGGTFAPRIATRSKKVAGVALLAGATRSIP